MANCSKESGRALLPYYKCLLPILNLFKIINLNKGDGIDYSQQKGANLGDLVQETLECLEKSGGSAAFVLIKQGIPTYESCVLRWIVGKQLFILLTLKAPQKCLNALC